MAWMAAVLARVCAALHAEWAAVLLPMSALAWGAAFLGFAAAYWGVLTGPRQTA